MCKVWFVWTLLLLIEMPHITYKGSRVGPVQYLDLSDLSLFKGNKENIDLFLMLNMGE
jgi:hypothetical protein